MNTLINKMTLLLILFIIILIIKIIINNFFYLDEYFINLGHSHFIDIFPKYYFKYKKKDNILTRNNNEHIKRKEFNSMKCRTVINNKLKTMNKFKELKDIEVPFPKSIEYDRTIDTKNSIFNKININNIKYPIVVKPINESQGVGVYVNIKSINELFYYINNALKKYNILQIQEMIQGENYRILVLNGKIIDILHRIVPYIIGDGKSSIKELIDKRNKKRKKGTETKIITESYIKQQGYPNINVGIPAIGRYVYITKTINYHNGSDIVVYPIDNVHSDTLKMLKDMMKKLDCTIGGIDYISKDLTKSFKESGNGSIIEINSGPYYNIHIRKNDKLLIANKIVNELDKYYDTIFT